MEIELHNNHGNIDLDATDVERLIRRMAEVHDLAMSACTVIITDDDSIRALHKRFFDDPTTTDVITFDLGDAQIEGEIYICADQAHRQAVTFEVAPADEVRRLIIHGVLHLAGFDDRTPDDRKIMKQHENRWYEQTMDWVINL